MPPGISKTYGFHCGLSWCAETDFKNFLVFHHLLRDQQITANVILFGCQFLAGKGLVYLECFAGVPNCYMVATKRLRLQTFCNVKTISFPLILWEENGGILSMRFWILITI